MHLKTLADMRGNKEFDKFCLTCECHLKADPACLEKLPSELYYCVFAQEEIFKTKYSIQFLYWLYVESSFSPMIRMIVNTLQGNIDNQILKIQRQG